MNKTETAVLRKVVIELLDYDYATDMEADDMGDIVEPLIALLNPEQEVKPFRDLSENVKGKVGRSHPSESEEAADRVLTGNQRLLVYEAIADSEDGLIDEEIAEVTGLSEAAARTRRKEISDGNYGPRIKRIGTRLTQRDGRAAVWSLTSEALTL